MCLVAAPMNEAAARDRNAGFIRQRVAEQSFCRLKSAFLAKDSAESQRACFLDATQPPRGDKLYCEDGNLQTNRYNQIKRKENER
jgi:hypothetical protein